MCACCTPISCETHDCVYQIARKDGRLTSYCNLSIYIFFKQDTIKVTWDSFRWTQCLLAEETATNCHTIFATCQIHPLLARRQRVPTLSLAAAFANGHQPSDIWYTINARITNLIFKWFRTTSYPNHYFERESFLKIVYTINSCNNSSKF